MKTIEELSKLPDEELRVTCAEAAGHVQLYYIRKPRYAPFDYYRPDACGYTSRPDEAWKVTKEVADTRTYLSDLRPGHEHYGERVIAEPVPPPDYPADLNAMHEAVESLDDVEKVLWAGELYLVARGNHHDKDVAMTQATSRQRCIAFIATKQREEGV